jgi:hypothetical protein
MFCAVIHYYSVNLSKSKRFKSHLSENFIKKYFQLPPLIDKTELSEFIYQFKPNF